jgi:hypothetical protein
MTTLNLANFDVHYHRNGVSGEGFYAVTFDERDEGDRSIVGQRPPVGSCYAQRHKDHAACGLERDHDGPHTWEGHEPARKMMAVVFPPDLNEDESEYDWDIYANGGWHNCRVAVFDADKLPDVRFFYNSWRGDRYAPALYEAIKKSR